MKNGREPRKRVRRALERADVQASEARHSGVRSMESCFEIAHVTWTKLVEEREPVVMGHASEPMS